jgi:hypothetical protein
MKLDELSEWFFCFMREFYKQSTFWLCPYRKECEYNEICEHVFRFEPKIKGGDKNG